MALFKKNAKQLPTIYYGLHFCDGVAEYVEGEESKRIYISEDTARDMNATFAGRPVYVFHVDEVNLDNLQAEADGYVVESFYNTADGKHWAKFIAVSDKAHEAIKLKHWKLSNAYQIKEQGAGGEWHSVQYDYEVKKAEYQHLAIVPNPRYQESIVLTPEEFQKYNESKIQDLKTLVNSKEEKKEMFNFFKKTEVKEDISGLMVTLKNGKEISIKQLINDAEEKIEEKVKDEAEEKKVEEKKSDDDSDKKQDDSEAKDKVYASKDHFVKVGDEEMTVNELIEKHLELSKPKNEEKKEEPKVEEKKSDDDDSMKKADDSDMNKCGGKKNAADEKYFEMLKNAGKFVDSGVIETSADQLQRGLSRYGSNK